MRSPIELIRLAERYARYLSEPTANPYLAWGRLGQIIRALPPTQAFDLACHLIRALPSSYLSSFGGGTLAHLVDHHGATLIDWIEREAWRDVDFLTALSNAWVADEGVHPTILIRLRVATGARIRIVRRPARNAAYKSMFDRWITGRPQRQARDRRKRSYVRPLAVEADGGTYSRLARSLTAADIPKELLFAKKVSLALRFQILLMILHYSVSSRPRFLQHMLRGATLVWLHWFLLTTVSARFLLPVLVIALCIISASLVTDLMLVALAFVLATVGAAVAGIVVGGVTEGRRQFPRALVYGGMSLTPYLTLIGLIARAEHGLIVAPAVVTGLVARPFIWRSVRRARAALRHEH